MSWVSSPHSGNLHYLKKNIDVRLNPRLEGILKDSQAVVSIAFPYGKPMALPPIWNYVATHARGRDYHNTLRNKLTRIATQIASVYPGLKWRVFVDSGPVMERTWAVLSELGVIGRNGMIIVPGYGVKVLLGEIFISNAPLDRVAFSTIPREPFSLCDASCRRCQRACPTGALSEDGLVDAGKCLSCLTVERRTYTIPENIRLHLDKFFGCDRCIDACPHNRAQFSILEPPAIANIANSLEEFVYAPAESLQQLLAGTCLYRTGAVQLQQQAQFLLDNSSYRCLGYNSDGKEVK
ncbi:MAG: DUF1730 domain-containing protein [Deltaproteobacteria bacterium]|nr:DUF1730 domain-containing protein [Deltaproteobacteria bacterium]